ncbi:MAG: type II toxin-antitoxin system VapC family toxin [bacterium]
MVDTSVWSLALRKGGPTDHTSVRKLREVLEHGEDVFLIGVILQELLQGFRDKRTIGRLSGRLQSFDLLPLERRHYVAAAQLRRRCVSNGVTPSTIDALIASAAIEHRSWLLTADDDFEHIARVTRLKLL